MEDLNLIKKLSAHQYYWSIKVLVTAKDDIKNFKSGNGKLQKFTLQDMEGSKIYAIMFNEIIEKLSNILQIGKIYIISNGQVKEINKNFYNVNENLEIILNNLTKIDEVDNEAVFTSSMKLSTISEIKANPNFPSDILLLVINVHEVRLIFRQRDKKQIVKRDLQVYGLRSEICILTLWESLAITEGQELHKLKDDIPIILVKSVVGKNFNGFTLSTISATTLQINPDLPESKEIKDWFLHNKLSLSTSSNKGISITDLLEINTCQQSSEQIKYYDTKVSIKGIKEQGNIWYDACNSCKTKVIFNEDSVECSKCAKKNIEHSLRYLIKLDVEDATSSAVYTLFDDEAEHIMGIPVAQLYKKKASNIEDYNKELNKLIGCTRIFSIKAQDKIYGNLSLRTLTVQAIKTKFDNDVLTITKKMKLEKD